MIFAHKRKSLLLRAGNETFEMAHAAFRPAKLHGKGGIHPAVVHEVQTWLHIPGDPASYDFRDCPVQPIVRTVELPGMLAAITETYIPIEAWLQAEYGPDKLIASVPINGDAHAQRLHWLHRDDAGRKEMRAILECLRAWRLNDDGSIPTEEEARARRSAALHPRIIPPPSPEEEDAS